MFILKRYITFFLFIIYICFHSSNSFASITWSSSQFSISGHSSLPSLCQALVLPVSSAWGQSVTYSSHQVRTTDGICTFSTASGGSGNVYVQKNGSVCDSNQTYNEQTGGCETPQDPNGEVCGPKDQHTGLPKIKNSAGECVDFPFADKPSQCNYAKNKVREVSVYAQFDSNGVPSGPPSIDVGGCVAVPIGPSPYRNCPQPAPRKSCFNGVCIELGAAPAKCDVSVQFTGATGDGEFGFTGNPDDGVGPCDPDTGCTPATPPIETDRQPCTYVTDAEGRQSCTSFDYKGVPGESSQCGQVNGVMQCIAKKPPTSNGTQIDTKVETKSNSDGTTTTTKTDIRTDVICSGPNACQSVTTKTTNVTIKDGNGNTTSSDTKCEGAKCSSGIGKGDGTGTGDGDCIVNCDDENGQVSAPELGEVATYAESIQAFQAAIEGSPIMSAVSSIAVTGSGSCNMGSTNTAIGTISLDYICNNSNWLDSLYFVFLAVWALAAVRVLLSA
ncbi:hypothetical protein ACMHYQ_11665 [Ectopseudomonas guguanensis]|uniref:hypothetical protein n=1 Tax=Ectopseudomonas guguanensis TaxID=1198456 RepID=UPI0039C3FA82